MLICQLALPSGATAAQIGAGSDRLELLCGDPLCGLVPSGETLPLTEDLWRGDRLLPPLAPGKIVAVGSNYHDHTVEMGKPLPKEPVLFMKPPSAVIGPGQAIRRPAGFARVDYEGELALVIGRPCHQVSEADAFDYLFGYTALNDVTIRELQKQDGQFTRAKGMDTFCPIGPAIQTDLSYLSPDRFRLITHKNGQQVQDSSGDRFLFGLRALVSFISHYMTLQPGDVISTGTPAGVGNLDPGDELTITITGLPPLRNPVVAAPEPLRLI